MKLALYTSWLILAVVAARAAPTPARRGTLLSEAMISHDQRRVYNTCTEGQTNCRVARQNTNEPSPSMSPDTPASTTTSLFFSSETISAPSSTSAPLSSTPQTMPSLTAHHPFHFDDLAAQSNPSGDPNDPDNHLRTVGIVGGFLAGTALVAVIGIILILIRKQRRRGSSASSSFGSRRSRTRSSTRPPPIPPSPVMAQPYSLPLTFPPPLRIHTGGSVTAIPPDLTTAGTVGHQSTGMHLFPTVEPESASSRTTSFGPHSSGTSSGGSNVPRRAPQIPSLGLSNPRPLMYSFGSLFSHRASTGHPTPTLTPTRTALDEEQPEHEQLENEEHAEPEHTEITAPSTFGSQTLAATEEIVGSDGHAQTEETRMSDDVTRTADIAHGLSPEALTDNQPKTS
ncbi:hypothetical protein OPQ81_004313 [Rhizoctonia solani]|nr:hypothetical protein OPQ81_004313 [Rhizoctonia solani]